MKIRIILTALLFICGGTLFAAFETTPVSVFGAGMGKAVVAHEQEAAFVVNPANIATRGMMYAGASSLFRGSMIPETLDLSGNAFARYTISDGLACGVFVNFNTFQYHGGFGSAGWNEFLVKGALSYNLSEFVPMLDILMAGLGISLQSFGGGDDVFEGEKVSAVDGDVGLVLAIAGFRMGLSANNLLRIDDSMNRLLNAGAAYAFVDSFGIKLTPSFEATFLVDSREFELKFGIEYSPGFPGLRLRAGILSYDTFGTFAPSLGASYRFGLVDISYAGSYNTTIGGVGEHSLGIGVLFEVPQTQVDS